MSDLASWLLEQVAEDERKAHAATWERWEVGPDGEVLAWVPLGDNGEDILMPEMCVTCDHEGLLPSVVLNDAEHIATWDPARVLAECEAKRGIVEIGRRLEADDTTEFVVGGGWDPGIGYAADAIEHVLRLLALPYADRPGFREEWRP